MLEEPLSVKAECCSPIQSWAATACCWCISSAREGSQANKQHKLKFCRLCDRRQHRRSGRYQTKLAAAPAWCDWATLSTLEAANDASYGYCERSSELALIEYLTMHQWYWLARPGVLLKKKHSTPQNKAKSGVETDRALNTGWTFRWIFPNLVFIVHERSRSRPRLRGRCLKQVCSRAPSDLAMLEKKISLLGALSTLSRNGADQHITGGMNTSVLDVHSTRGLTTLGRAQKWCHG